MSEKKAVNFEKRHLAWPLLNLSERFMNSDFLANYSRGYVWAANQLGHYTLGLIGALGYFWFADTLYRAFSGAGVLRGGGALQMSTSDIVVAVFAVLVLIGVVLGLGLLAYRIGRKPLRLHQIAAERAARIDAAGAEGRAVERQAVMLNAVTRRMLMIEKAERIGMIAGLLLFLGVAALIITLSFAQNIRGAFEWRAYAGSVLATTLFFAALAALLSQSAHYTLMSWTVLAAAALMWEPRALDAAGLPAPFEPPEALSAFTDAPLLAILAALFLGLLILSRREDNFGRAPLWILVPVGACFLIGAMTPDPEIRRAVAAGFASLAVWWVKEFGSDLPRIEDEIQDAHDARVANGQSDWNGVSHVDDYAETRSECLDDTLCDARTDSLFYLAGAVLAVGLLISPSVIDVEASRVIPAFGAAILFLALYWHVGWFWIRRAVQLDRVLVLAAQRFAMMESAFVTKLTVGRYEANPDGSSRTPRGAMQRMRAFARGELVVEGGDGARRPVQHLIICGRFGAGRSALGHALACEAALVNAPPWSAAPERQTDKPLRWARFVTMRGVFERYVFSTRGRAADEAELVARRGAPDLFVIDQADPYALETVEAYRAWADQTPDFEDSQTSQELARSALEPLACIRGGAGSARERLIRSMLRLLQIDVTTQRAGTPAPDQTVWIIYAETEAPTPGAPWDPAIPPRALDFAEDLRGAIAHHAGGAVPEENIAIGYAIVGRPHLSADAQQIHTGAPRGLDRELIAEAGGL